MADKKYPYVTGPKVLVQLLDDLRKAFPSTLNADTLKRMGLGLNNESFYINTVRFLGLIDDKNARTEKAAKVFANHNLADFQEAFSDIVKVAYHELFSLRSDEAWKLEQDKLATFFRQADQSSAVVGEKQARTFRVLADYAGYDTPISQPRSKPTNSSEKVTTPKKSVAVADVQTVKSESNKIEAVNSTAAYPPIDRNFGLTVRIEINLPADGDQSTYDKIFKSIRENLLNG